MKTRKKLRCWVTLFIATSWVYPPFVQGDTFEGALPRFDEATLKAAGVDHGVLYAWVGGNVFWWALNQGSEEKLRTCHDLAEAGKIVGADFAANYVPAILEVVALIPQEWKDGVKLRNVGPEKKFKALTVEASYYPTVATCRRARR